MEEMDKLDYHGMNKLVEQEILELDTALDYIKTNRKNHLTLIDSVLPHYRFDKNNLLRAMSRLLDNYKVHHKPVFKLHNKHWFENDTNDEVISPPTFKFNGDFGKLNTKLPLYFDIPNANVEFNESDLDELCDFIEDL